MAHKEYLADDTFTIYLGRTFPYELSGNNDSSKVGILSSVSDTYYYLVQPLQTQSSTAESFNYELSNYLTGWRVSFEPEIYTYGAGDWKAYCYVPETPVNTVKIECHLVKSAYPFPKTGEYTNIAGADATISTNEVIITISAPEFTLESEYLFLVFNYVVTAPASTEILSFRVQSASVYLEYPSAEPDLEITDATVNVDITPTASDSLGEITSASVDVTPTVDSAPQAGEITSGEVVVEITNEYSHFTAETTSVEIDPAPTITYLDYSAIIEDITIDATPSVVFSDYGVALTNVTIDVTPAIDYVHWSGICDSVTIDITPTITFEEWTLTKLVTDGARIDRRTVSRGDFYRRR